MIKQKITFTYRDDTIGLFHTITTPYQSGDYWCIQTTPTTTIYIPKEKIGEVVIEDYWDDLQIQKNKTK